MTTKVNGKRVAIYDNGGKSFDRYTVVYLWAGKDRIGRHSCVEMSECPFHPHGFGQHGDCQNGRHLGKRIQFEDLPSQCQRLVWNDCN